MNILEALKHEDGDNDVRLTHYSKWLYWNGNANVFVVRGHEYGERGSRVVLETENEEEAVKALLE